MNIDPDYINNAKPVAVANAAMAVIDALQLRFQAHEQVMGAAAAFLCIAQASGIPAQELFTATKNLMNGVDGQRSEFRAVLQYVKEEL